MQNQQISSDKRNNIKSNLISILLTVVIFIALGKYLYDNREIFNSLQKLNLTDILILIGLYFFFILTLSYLNKIIIHKLDPRISIAEIVSLQFINNFLNKILPKGGVAFRAMYLKRHYHLSFSYFLATFTGLVVVNLVSQALISLGAMLLIFLQTGTYNLLLVFGFNAMLLGSLFIIILKPSISANNNRILQSAQRLVEGWKVIVQDPQDLAVFIVISLLLLLQDALSFYVVFSALEIPIQYSTTLILSSLSIILSYINVTPDGLGVREGVYIYVSSIVALTEPQILFGSLVQRAISLIASLIFSGLGYVLLQKNKKSLPPLETSDKNFV
jgi:uncharacterized protein (TIRG00374 family)